jgi:hypothetical protein
MAKRHTAAFITSLTFSQHPRPPYGHYKKHNFSYDQSLFSFIMIVARGLFASLALLSSAVTVSAVQRFNEIKVNRIRSIKSCLSNHCPSSRVEGGFPCHFWMLDPTASQHPSPLLGLFDLCGTLNFVLVYSLPPPLSF